MYEDTLEISINPSYNADEFIEDLKAELEIQKDYPEFKVSNYDEIYFDGRKSLIQRCLNNVIDNAIKFGKLINISLKKDKNNIYIKIDDDGPGIDEKELENVFKPFYKIDKGRDISKSSVGLGLSIASDIIKSHGGKISLTRSSANGLSVEIILPF